MPATAALAEGPGALDQTFNAGSAGLDPAGFSSGPAHAVHLDGDIVVAPGATTYIDAAGTHDVPTLVRLNADGTVDAGFAVGGAGVEGTVLQLAAQPDGKTIVVGNITGYDDSSGFHPVSGVFRVNADGSFDASFNAAGTGLTSVGTAAVGIAVALQPDGRILVGGEFQGYTDGAGFHPSVNIVRLNTDGSVDTSFNAGGAGFTAAPGAFGNAVYDLAVAPDGRIVLGGDLGVYNDATGDHSFLNIVRLNTDGSYDASFTGAGVGTDSRVRRVVVQTDGAVLASGWFGSYLDATGPHPVQSFVRILSDGSYDAGFNAGGTGVDNLVTAIELQADGRILIGGYFSSWTDASGAHQVGNIARLHPDGSFDTSFDEGGAGFDAEVEWITSLDDETVLATGSFHSFGDAAGVHVANRIARLVVPTPRVPAITTTLVDAADGDHVLPHVGGDVVDTVSYTGLEPGSGYVLSGELMDAESGAATGIVGSTSFTASATGDGTVTVDFTIPDGWAGHTLVAFESLTFGGTEVAAHRDLDDAQQTVYLHADDGSVLGGGVTSGGGSTAGGATGGAHGGTSHDGTASLAITGGTLAATPFICALLLMLLGAVALIRSRRRA